MSELNQEENIETRLLESFICLLSKIRFAQQDDSCKLKSNKLKPALQTSKKKKELESKIKDAIQPTYEKYRDSIIDKDFSFVEESNLQILDVNLSEIFPRIFEMDDAPREKEAVNEMLNLFYQVMTPEDRKETEQRHAKKKTKKLKKLTDKSGGDTHTPPNAQSMASAIPDPTNMIQQLLAENAPHLKEAERDPSKMADAIGKVVSSSRVSDMIANMVKNLLKADTLK